MRVGDENSLKVINKECHIDDDGNLKLSFRAWVVDTPVALLFDLPLDSLVEFSSDQKLGQMSPRTILTFDRGHFTIKAWRGTYRP